MIQKPHRFNVLPCWDSMNRAAARQRAFTLSRRVASALGRSAVEAAGQDYYVDETGVKVDGHDSVAAACAAQRSLPPDAALSGLPAGLNRQDAGATVGFPFRHHLIFCGSNCPQFVARYLSPMESNSCVRPTDF